MNLYKQKNIIINNEVWEVIDSHFTIISHALIKQIKEEKEDAIQKQERSSWA